LLKIIKNKLLIYEKSLIKKEKEEETMRTLISLKINIVINEY
jgi:hypothetical protein